MPRISSISAASRARVDGEDANVDPVAAHVGDHVAEPRHLVGENLQVRDDEDRTLLRAGVDERRVCFGEAGRDSSASAEVLPGIGREAAGGAVRVGTEEAEEGQQLAARRARRQHLYAESEKTTSPARSPCLAIFCSVEPKAASYTLAERSSTTTPVVPEGTSGA